MSRSERWSRWLRIWGASALLLWGLAGCQPEFEETSCATDGDCFTDEVCSAGGVCVREEGESGVLEIESFEADADEVAAGESVTLSWELQGAAEGAIAGTDGFSYTLPGADLDEGSVTVEDLQEDATYTLTIGDVDGEEVTAEIDVDVLRAQDPPTIVSFEADAPQVAAGESVTLSWEVEGADTIVIEELGGAEVTSSEEASGSVDVTIDATTVYTLTATNDAGSTESNTVTVSLLGAPVIESFAASRTEDVEPGASIELSWQVTNSQDVVIEDSGGEVITTSQTGMGSTQVTVDATETYTLTATNPSGMVSEQVTVEVVAAPVINDFSASQEMDVAPDTTIDLSWDVTGATAITITDGDDNTIVNSDQATGSTQALVVAPTTYTLTATGPGGEASADISVTVLGAPVIVDFTAAETSDLIPGNPVEFSWEVTGADEITITDEAGDPKVESMDATGMANIFIQEDQTYTLTATNDAGSVTETVTVTVLPPPAIVDFSASQTSDVVPGTDVDLDWEVTGADSITIKDSAGSTIHTSMAAVGSYTVNITANETYTLEAINAASTTTSSPVQITLLGSPVVTSFTATEDTDIIPGDTIDLSWDVTDAMTITISDSSGQLTSSTMATGTYTVTVNQDETYTLAAINATGTTNAMISVTVLDAPTINDFSASATDDLEIGQTIDLDWDVTGADMITISDSSGQIHSATTATGTYTATISQAETYTLEATNVVGSDTDTVTTTLRPAPAIVSFDATDKDDVEPNTMIGLSWQATQADDITITDSAMNTVHTATSATGSVMVTITQDETFTLTASNPNGDDTETLSVTVLVAPVVNDFSTPQTMDLAAGSTIPLSWDVSGPATITISDASGQLTSSTMATGTYMVTVNQDETFTLEATNAVGADSAMIMVDVDIVPVINSFMPSESMNITPGDTIDLSWDVSGADTVTISDSSGQLTSSMMATGTYTATVNQNETYTLEATNADGSVDDSIMVTVLGVPTINSFMATETMNITPGDTIDLSWDVSGADTVTISDASGQLTSSMMATGTYTATVNQNETYTLEATNAAGPVDDSIMVTVAAAGTPPTIDAFEADVTMTYSGQRVQLDWLISDADSVQVTDDQGGAPYDVPAGDIASGSYVVRPQVTTIYTITATNTDGSVMDSATVTVSAAPLLITEVFYDAAGADTDLEWVELYNTGETFVDLSHYSLGFGGSDYTTGTYQLDPIIIPPKGTVVVGGPTSSVDNYNPTLDQAEALGGLQNSGANADGIGLFFLEAVDITAAAAPIDKVVYGSANTNGLLGEDGQPAPAGELSPAVAPGHSLARASEASDVFVDRATPDPNSPFDVTSLSVTRGPTESTDTFTLHAFGVDDDLDELTLGTTPLACISASPDELLCEFAQDSTDAGDVALTLTRTSEYTQDASGASQVTALMAADQFSYSVADAFFFEARENPPVADFYCSHFVNTTSVLAGAPITITGLLYVAGVTDSAGGDQVPTGWAFQVGYVDVGVVPYQTFQGNWVDTTGQMNDSVNPGNELLTGDVTSSMAMLAEAAFRVSRDGGTTWIYCDSQSSPNPGTNAADWEEGVLIEWQ